MKEIILTRDNLVETGEEIAKFLWIKNYPTLILYPENEGCRIVHQFIHLKVMAYFSGTPCMTHELDILPPGKDVLTGISFGEKVIFRDDTLEFYDSEGRYIAKIS